MPPQAFIATRLLEPAEVTGKEVAANEAHLPPDGPLESLPGLPVIPIDRIEQRCDGVIGCQAFQGFHKEVDVQGAPFGAEEVAFVLQVTERGGVQVQGEGHILARLQARPLDGLEQRVQRGAVAGQGHGVPAVLRLQRLQLA